MNLPAVSRFRVALRRAAAACGLALVFAAAPPAAAGESPIRCAVTAEVRRMGAQNWTFQIEGSINLPDNATLHLELLYLKQVKSPPRVAAQGTPFVIEEVTVDEATADVRSGRFSASMAFFPEEPFAGDYVAVVRVPLEAQIDAVAKFLAGVGEVPEHRHAFRHGSLEDLDRQRRTAADSVRTDMITLHRLQQEAQALFESAYARPEPGINEFVAALTSDWDPRYHEIQARNQLRPERDLFWVQWYGRRYIDMLLSDLRSVVGRYRDSLALPAAERPPKEKVLEFAEMFNDTYFMWMEYLQFTHPQDTSEARRLLQDLRQLLRDFGKWYEESRAVKPDAAVVRTQLQGWQGKVLAGIASLSQSLPDFEFAPLTQMTRDVVRILRDASTGLVAGDAVAQDRVAQGLAQLLVSLDRLEEGLK